MPKFKRRQPRYNITGNLAICERELADAVIERKWDCNHYFKCLDIAGKRNGNLRCKGCVRYEPIKLTLMDIYIQGACV